MSTAQILYKQYKALPKRLQNELKQLINTEEEELIEINLPEFKKAVKQVKLLREGKLKTTPAREFLAELEKELGL
jgi:PHP family Zn ribbon phosphoesterase